MEMEMGIARLKGYQISDPCREEKNCAVFVVLASAPSSPSRFDRIATLPQSGNTRVC